ncbi:MAG TPA: hypothetical protein VKU40_03960, partial [Thermoanaerobaculia bacterium]|nr:hypothetical protein [Thermoanaerobaculia bacterium]
LCNWCYSREGSVGDRLAMVQNVVCREAWGTEPEGAFHAILTRAPTILDQVRHGWKSFIEGKVDTFFNQLQSLEEHVAETVRGVAEQTGKLVGQLSTTVLAAVGVLLGALLLPVLKDGDVDPWVLAVGMVVYGLYVLIFPGIYGLLSQWQAQRALKSGFDERYERFERQLPTHLVEGVGRQAVDGEVCRFRLWFGAVLLTYAVLVLGLYAGALLLGLRALGWR